MPGFGSSTSSIASVLAAQAYVAERPAPAQPVPRPRELPAPEAVPTDGTVHPVGDARRFRRWSTLGTARRAVL